MFRLKRTAIFLLLGVILIRWSFGQSGTVKSIDVAESNDGKIQLNVYDVAVKGMYHKDIHFGMWLSQEGVWLEDSWVEIESQYVEYDPVVWKGHAFWFYYPVELLMKKGNPDNPYWGSFFIMDTENNKVIGRKDVEFTLSVEKNTDAAAIDYAAGDIVSTFDWSYNGKRYKEAFVIGKADYSLSVDERNHFQPLTGSSDYKDGYIMLSGTDMVTFYSDLYGFLYQKNRYRLSDMTEKFLAMKKKYAMNYGQFAEFVINCIQYTTYKLPDEMYGIFTQLELVESKTGDCDTRSVILYTLLKDLGYDVAIFYSEYYQHAMLGIANVGGGEYLKHEGIKYYFVETTATGWDIGALPPDWSNTRHWQVLIPIER